MLAKLNNSNSTLYNVYAEYAMLGYCNVDGNAEVLADDEYSKWTGDIYPIKCEECGAINEFEDCDTD